MNEFLSNENLEEIMKTSINILNARAILEDIKEGKDNTGLTFAVVEKRIFEQEEKMCSLIGGAR